MAITPVPSLTAPQNVGYSETDPRPIIHSIRWRHLPSRYIFSSVSDVITFHQRGLQEIDIKKHSVTYLDIYCRKDVNIKTMDTYLRYVTETEGILIEEPYEVGEGGKDVKLSDDPINPELKVIKGLAFTQKDVGDGTPMYDFVSMTGEGIYELWLKLVTDKDEELHVRVPFVWANLYGDSPENGSGGGSGSQPNEPVQPKVEGPLHAEYDEYYVTIIEGDSPFTKRPSTHFRMAGVGMLQNPFCFERVDTPPQNSIDKPADNPVIGDEPPEPCALTVSPTTLTVEVGKQGKFNLNHKNDSGVLKIEMVADETAVDDLGNGSFKVLRTGKFNAEYVVTYEDGQECSVDVEIGVVAAPTPPASGTGDGDGSGDGSGSGDGAGDGGGGDSGSGDGGTTEPAPAPTPKPEPTPDPNPNEPTQDAYCGDVINGSSGHNSVTLDVTESGTYYIEYNFFSEEDEMFIYVGGVLQHTTGVQKFSTTSPFGFKYKPSDGKLKITMNNKNEGTRWSYTLFCPNSVPPEVKVNAPIVF